MLCHFGAFWLFGGQILQREIKIHTVAPFNRVYNYLSVSKMDPYLGNRKRK